MSIIQKFFGGSPFPMLLEHTRKVHECVELLRPLTDALLSEDFDKMEELHDVVSRTEHEADEIKSNIRKRLHNVHLMSVGRNELQKFLSYQDNVADSAEDFAVVLILRKTTIPEALKEDFREFVYQVIQVSEHLLQLAEELTILAESAFTGTEAEKVLNDLESIGQEEWKVDRLGRHFAQKFYAMEDELSPITILFLDKYCRELSEISNSAEKAAKYLRQIILSR